VPPPEFRRLNLPEAELGHAILVETIAWLAGKNIQLWTEPLPREIYFARQERGENFGLFVGEDLAAVLALIDVPPYWKNDVQPGARWLSTLATARNFHGGGWGRRAVECACEWLANEDIPAVYLDTKPGFLEEFYLDLGFQIMMQREFRRGADGPAGVLVALLMYRSLRS
jgi:GNAT superfamily N-acetyltransferase